MLSIFLWFTLCVYGRERYKDLPDSCVGHQGVRCKSSSQILAARPGSTSSCGDAHQDSQTSLVEVHCDRSWPQTVAWERRVKRQRALTAAMYCKFDTLRCHVFVFLNVVFKLCLYTHTTNTKTQHWDREFYIPVHKRAYADCMYMNCFTIELY